MTPSHERMSLTAEDLDVTAHIDGVALRFGPGVPTYVADSFFDATRAKRTAIWALQELSNTLARTSTEKGA